MSISYFVNYLPITKGNSFKPYVDGESYCADLYSALQDAKRFVFLTGLHFMRNFELLRRKGVKYNATVLSKVLTQTAHRGVKIYLLVNQFWRDESELYAWVIG